MTLGRLVLAAALVLLAAGCMGDGEATETQPTTGRPTTSSVRVYWVRDGNVWPVARDVDETGDSGQLVQEAITELLAGPTDQEASELGLATAISEDVEDFDITDDLGRVSLTLPSPQSDEALAQIVYTLTQFEDIRTLEIDGRTVTRASFEEQTPAILVESPLAYEDVVSPLRVTGTANTFEANFQYELTDTDGKIVDENFVTATSGTGTRGTFDFTTDAFSVPFTGVGSLIVFESSAKDGSRINLVEIPLRMKKE